MKTLYLIGLALLLLASCDDSSSGNDDIFDTKWQAVETNTQNNLIDVFFLDKDNGWFLTDQGYLYRTTNAGKSWAGKMILNSYMYGSEEGCQLISFTDNLNGWIAYPYSQSYGGSLYSTTDGGLSFSQVKYTNNSSNYYITKSVVFTDANNGWVLSTGNYSSENDVYRTIDGGKNWGKLNLNGQVINSIFFIDNLNGFLAGKSDLYSSKGLFKKTTDGGQTWSDKLLDNYYNFSQVFFVSVNTGFLVDATNKKMFKTTDGGQAWTEIYSDNEYAIKRCFFVDENNGYLIFSLPSQGYNAYDWYPLLKYTTDGGQNWELSKLYTNYATNNGSGYFGASNVFFLDTKNGWLAGKIGSLWHTTKGPK